MATTLSPPPLSTPLSQKDGLPSPTWSRWLSQLQALAKGLGGALQPTTPALATQSGSLFMGTGAPSNSDGNDGDFYFRTDTPGLANQRVYVKDSGAWVGIL